MASAILRDIHRWMICVADEIVDKMIGDTIGDTMQSKKYKTRILFLCTGNSARSQMAEGWVKYLKGNVIEPYSAGIEAHGVNPYAIAVMKEVGIDISRQRSKLVKDVFDTGFDYVVTLCSHADENCPIFPGRTKIVHISFDDPARSTGSEEEIMATFRKVRDEIKTFIEGLPDSLER